MVDKTPLEIIQNRRRQLLICRGYAALGLRVCVLVLGVWILFSQVFLLHRVSGQGMFPAIKNGDLVLAYRLHTDYDKGDVVVYRQEDALSLGRVVAGQADVVMMDDSGDLQINGTTQDSGILYPTYAREDGIYPMWIQEGTVYVLGDYRTRTRDSRDFGPIPVDDILGKVITILRRRGL